MYICYYIAKVTEDTKRFDVIAISKARHNLQPELKPGIECATCKEKIQNSFGSIIKEDIVFCSPACELIYYINNDSDTANKIKNM